MASRKLFHYLSELGEYHYFAKFGFLGYWDVVFPPKQAGRVSLFCEIRVFGILGSGFAAKANLVSITILRNSGFRDTGKRFCRQNKPGEYHYFAKYGFLGYWEAVLSPKRTW